MQEVLQSDVVYHVLSYCEHLDKFKLRMAVTGSQPKLGYVAEVSFSKNVYASYRLYVPIHGEWKDYVVDLVNRSYRATHIELWMPTRWVLSGTRAWRK